MFNREFKRYIDSGTSTIEIKYTSNDFFIQKITITKKDKHPTDKWYRDCLRIECDNTIEGKKLADKIFHATNVVKIWEGQSIEEAALRRNNEVFYTKYTSVDDIKRLIHVLHGVLHHDVPIIDENMRDQILEDVDIKVYCDDIHAGILTEADININRGKELALQFAKEYGYREILWLLAEHFRKKNLIEDAVEMYEAIPSDNKFYANACLMLMSFYQGQLTANQMKIITLMPKEIQTIREKIFELSLLAKDHQFSTAMFYDLSVFGLIADAPQIKLDGNTPETFIFLAQQIAQVNNENRRLRLELLELKKKIQSDSAKDANTSHTSLYGSASPTLYAQLNSRNSARVTKLMVEDDYAIRNVL